MRKPDYASASSDRQGDEARVVSGLHAHQHVLAAVLARAADGLAHIAGSRHRLAADFEDDVAGREAVLGGYPRRVDIGDDDALLAGAFDTRRRRQSEAELA